MSKAYQREERKIFFELTPLRTDKNMKREIKKIVSNFEG